MPFFTLYNRHLRRPLRHPQVGIWYTPDLQEAKDMLASCREYVKSLGVAGYENQFIIVDAETNDPIEPFDDMAEYMSNYDLPARPQSLSSDPV